MKATVTTMKKWQNRWKNCCCCQCRQNLLKQSHQQRKVCSFRLVRRRQRTHPSVSSNNDTMQQRRPWPPQHTWPPLLHRLNKPTRPTVHIVGCIYAKKQLVYVCKDVIRKECFTVWNTNFTVDCSVLLSLAQNQSIDRCDHM